MKTAKTLQELAVEIERQHKSKRDYVASTKVIEMKPKGNDVVLALPEKGEFKIGDIAHDQIAEHVKIPKVYYDRMRKEEPQLLATNVDRWFAKYPAPRMVRVLDDRARAFLSNGFQPLDNYDFAGATLPVLRKRNLKVVSCEITEKRLYIKAIDEALFRDVPVGYKMGDGSHQIFDTVAPVVILGNSEVGFGRLFVETGVYTSACTNLAMFASGGMKRTHIGARNRIIDEMGVEDFDSIMKSETRQKTMEALWLQVRDVISSAFDGKVIEKRCEQLAAAAGHKISGKVEKVLEVAAEKFGFNDVERDSIFRHLIEGGQLSQYGLHAAITRASQDVESYDRATELEYVGGKVIELAPSEWQQLAEAA